VLMTCPEVADVVVVGLPDERWGQRVVAVVAAAPGAEPDLDTLRAHGAAALASYKLPREVVVVDTVERTPAGKADYAWALATAEAHRPAS
jgi:acyl-CoA synthetase (AMP-forming)/AMP-acid ligase II